MNLETRRTLPLYFLVFGIFLIFISPYFLSDGMFVDGLIYSTISKNLANGIGTLCRPHFTATCFAEFHEHPPLAFAIQSVFFRIFGESRYIDKIYSFLPFLITGWIILKIWKQLSDKNGWLPLLFWVSIPVVSWTCTNNLLENTLMIFTSLSVWFYIKSHDNRKLMFLLLSGVMLFLGFLTKGFVAFFPWTFPLFYWLFFRKMSFYKMLADSAVVIVFSVIPMFLLIILFPEVKQSFQNYMEIQVLNSLKSIVTVDTRFFIIKRMFSELLPVFGLCLFFIIWAWLKKVPLNFLKTNYRSALFLFLFGLTGVLPIMISMKQSGFYILATYPFLAMAFGLWLSPMVDALFNKINYQAKGFIVFKWLGYVVFCTGVFWCIYNAGNISRDKNKIKDTYAIISEIPAGTTINIPPEIWNDWSLHAYFNRYKEISLDPDLSHKREFFLLKKDSYADSILNHYKKADIYTTDYILFKKIH